MTIKDPLPPHGIYPNHPLAPAGFMPIDTETFPISREHRYPPAVILQAFGGQHTTIANFGIEEQRAHIEDWFTKRLATTGPRAVTFVGVNIKYDMIVLAKEFPHLHAAIWDKYEAGQVIDLGTVHKVLNLYEYGELNMNNQGQRTGKEDYSEGMVELIAFYLDEERVKSDARYHFDKVFGQPVEHWLPGFREYADADGVDTWRILDAQLKRIERLGAMDAVKGVAPRRALMHFAMGWMTEVGIRVDPERAVQITQEVEESLDPAHFPLLVQTGILTPAEPPRQRFTAAGKPMKKHEAACTRKGDCDCPDLWTVGADEKVSRKLLQEHVLRAAREQGRSVPLTDKGVVEYRDLFAEKVRNLPGASPLFDEHPNWIKADKSAYTVLSLKDPILAEYHKRSETSVLRSNYTSRWFWDYVNEQPAKKADQSNVGLAERVYPDFNDLVSTGRTSAFASSLYPSIQAQNPDPRVRPAFVADPDYILVSTDYASLELCAVADKLESLDIPSRLVQLYREGKDPHADLAAGLLKQMAPDQCPVSLMVATTVEEEYEAFVLLKKEEPVLYKFWRTFAKPSGLGAWGAMGATTLAAVARGYPGLEKITPEECKAAIEVWRKRYPEQEAYFNYIRNFMRDEDYERMDEEGEVRKKYWFRTHDGLVRRNCTWSMVSNNFGLQAPGAEGACRMVPRVVRECIDPTLNSPLYGSYLLSFLHDEDLAQIPIHEDYADTQRAIDRLEEIMVTEMGKVISRVPLRVESVAMYRWDKYAKEERTEEGWLIPADEVPNYPDEEAA